MPEAAPHGRIGVVQMLDLEAWRAAHARGAVPSRLPYGLEELERQGRTLAVAGPSSRRLPRALERVTASVAHRLGLQVDHACRAVAAARANATVLAVFEDEALALGLLRAHGWWPRHDPRLVVLGCWLAQRAVDWPRAPKEQLGRAMRQADAIVCLSANQPAVVRQRLGVAPERLHTTVLGIDAGFYGVGRLTRSRHVLAVGTDTGRDFPGLLAAVAGTGIETRLITAPWQLEGVDLPPEAVALGATDNVRYRRELHEAAVVAIPSHPLLYPTGQTVLLEAMAAGCACVVSDGPAIREYVEDGRTAVLVRPGDPEALRAALVALVDDAPRRAALGAAAREAVEARFTTRHMWAGAPAYL